MTVHVCDVDGVVDQISETIEDQAPVYLAWSHDGKYLATLSQHEEQLELNTYRSDDLRWRRTIARGSPLFFTWADDRVAAYVGRADGTRGELLILDPTGSGETTCLSPVPKNFCAPIWRRQEVVYVADVRGRLTVVRAAPRSGTVRYVEPVQGLVAIVASPDGSHIARAMARDGDGSPYTDLAIIDLRTDEWFPLSSEPCLAFLWTPTGDALVVASVDTQRNLLQWWVQEIDGSRRHLIDMRPTREFAFYLRFFEQYASTHPIIDPSGEAIVLGGELHDGTLRTGEPRLWWLPLDGSPPSEIGPGVFAVFPRSTHG